MSKFVIFPKDITLEEKLDIETALHKKGYINSHGGAPKALAIGICTYDADDAKTYTFLNDAMASNNPAFSWTIWRTECPSVEAFLAELEKE